MRKWGNGKQTVVSQARPYQPQRGSLSVSCTGKEGSGVGFRVHVECINTESHKANIR